MTPRPSLSNCWQARIRWVVTTLLMLGHLAVPDAARAASAALEPFFGSYVGSAEMVDLTTGETRQRDLDIVIQPFREAGFQVNWLNIMLVDGRRDVPGVKRWLQTVLFQPAEGRDFYVEVKASNPFRTREQAKPLRGDPIRWARIRDGVLHVYAFQLLPDGNYELQIYDRILTEQGLDIRFERIVDDQPVRRLTGRTVRAEAGGTDD